MNLKPCSDIIAGLRKKIVRQLRDKKRLLAKLFGIMSISLMILVADYYASNMTFPILDSSPDLSTHAFLHDSRVSPDITGLIFPVNTAKDKALAKSLDIFGREEGYVAVTDRKKLADFLGRVSGADYKYIFLDVRFEEGVTTPYDSVLFYTISRTPRLVYSRHRSQNGKDAAAAAHTGVDEKSALADYRSTINSGFSRYEFLQDGRESVALRMFHDITGRTIEPTKTGGYRDTDGSLCYNLQFVPFPIGLGEKFAADGEIRYPLMGFRLLERTPADELREKVRGKIIVIGDFDNDLHDTYVGEVPGPLLSMYAWNVLSHDGHKVNIPLQGCLFVFYTIVIFIILLPDDKKHVSHPVLSLILSLLGWSFSLWVLKSLLYWLFGLSFIVMIPAVTFSAIDFIHNAIQKYQQKHR